MAHATGGLIDSIVDCNARTLAAGTASGFLYAESTAAGLLAAIERALDAYRDAPTWRAIQRNGMARNFGWDASAEKYIEIYRRVAAPEVLRPRP